MMKIQVVKDAKQILSLLYQFDCVFIHMREKVQNYDLFAKKLAQNALVYLIQQNEETCGLSVMYANDTDKLTAFITLFGFLPEWQGKHLGKEMIDFCCTEAKAKGMKSIRLEVDLDNHRAIAFYAHNGFLQCGTCSPTSMYMEKALV